MNYIKQLKAFYTYRRNNRLSAGQTSLYFTLLDIDNELGFAEWFNVSGSTLEALSGQTRQNVLNSRRKLKSLGLIDYRTRGSLSAEYKITELDNLYPLQSSLQNGLQDNLHEELHPSLQSSFTYNKQYNTKEDETKQDNSFSGEKIETPSMLQKILNDLGK